MDEDRMLNDEILLGLIKANGGGGGGGTTNYNLLENKPQIAGTTLQGNKSLADLGIASAQSVSNITNGESINNFAGVESALSGKQDALTAGDYIDISAQNEIKVNRSITKTQVHKYNMFFNSGRYCTITKYIDNEQVGSATTYDYLNMSPNPAEIDDVMTLKANGDTGNWLVTNLVASHDHTAGYVETRYRGSNDNTYVQEFDVVVDADKKLIIQSELDDAMATKQDALTFDDTPTDGSNNPVKSNGIYDALALKQNATDNNLDTEAKTIVGAINEHEGDISSLKSGLTTLDDEVNGDATTYDFADVITIEDAVPANLADCSVKIEPVQDLHGQSAPYVGGAGKNKLPLTVDSIKALNSGLTWNGNTAIKGGVTFTILTDSDNNVLGIKALGTSTAQIWYFNVAHITTTETMLFNTGNTYSWDANKIVCEVTDGTNTYHASTLNGVEVPPGTYDVVIAAQNNATVDVTFLPMLRVTPETDATFAPYTNICPISGHTEVDVQRDGKNLCDWKVDIATNALEIALKSGTYTISAKSELSNGNWYFRLSDANGEYSYTPTEFGNPDFMKAQSGWFYGASWVQSITFIVPSGCSKVEIAKLNADGTIPAQLELGSTVTSYEPYAGKTYTIALGDTIYGGTVDFDSGVMTVTHKYFAPASVDDIAQNAALPTDKWLVTVNDGKAASDVISNMYFRGSGSTTGACGVTNTGKIRVNTYSVYESAEAAFSGEFDGSEFCYELATPTTIQLTHQQIQLLKGTNTLYASTGQISVTVNGVSGSIGAVQEQVNGLAEDVADIEDDVTELQSGQENHHINIGLQNLITLTNDAPAGTYISEARLRWDDRFCEIILAFANSNGFTTGEANAIASIDWTSIGISFTGVNTYIGTANTNVAYAEWGDGSKFSFWRLNSDSDTNNVVMRVSDSTIKAVRLCAVFKLSW